MKANRGGGKNGGDNQSTALPRPFADLQRRYTDLVLSHQRLLNAYSGLIDRYRFMIHDRGETATVAEWFMGAMHGFALLRHGAVIITNHGLHALEEMAGAGGWRELAADDAQGDAAPATYSSLRLVMQAMCSKAIAEKRDLAEARWEGAAGTPIVDVRVQRGIATTTYVGMAADVTERVRAETELAAARESQFRSERMRSLGSLSSGLAHDINNSLNALKLHLTVLEMNGEKLPQKLPTLNRIVDDCASLVRRLQDFARQRKDPPLGHCRIEQVIGEAVQTVHSELVEKTAITRQPITISVKTPPLPIVPGDPVELRHVFVNLLLNARDAMLNGGKIEITGRAENDRVIISVIDEGVGIPPHVLDHLFDPFFTTKGPRGTGLGLATAYGVMTRLGGEIRAENHSGGGAAFTVTFPATPDEHAERPRADRGANGDAAPRRILAIDDHPENVEPLKNLFEIKGHHVDVAFSGADAIDRFSRGGNYDLVLCDVGMPGMNGWQVAERLREMSPATAIYLLTGWAQEIPPDEPRRALIDGLLSKPVDLERLKKIISRSD